jgi:adenylate cyclase
VIKKAKVVEMPKPALPLDGWCILVVDDEADIRTFLRTVLEDAGAKVGEAADGNQALAQARALKPDLITLDLSMEGKNGIETFAELRSENGLASIPVCIVTGHPEFREVIYSRAVPPPEGYMDKPIKEEQLVENVRRILALQSHKVHA